MLKLGDLLIAKRDVGNRVMDKTFIMKGHRYVVIYTNSGTKEFGVINEYGFAQRFDSTCLYPSSNSYTFDNQRVIRMKKIKSLYK